MQEVFRVGKVHTINESRRTVRVKYEMYGGMLSAELKVIWQKEQWLPKINEEVFVICPPDGDGDGYVIGRC